MGPDENYSTVLLFLLYTGLSSDSKEDFQRRHSTPVSDVIRLCWFSTTRMSTCLQTAMYVENMSDIVLDLCVEGHITMPY